MFFMIETRGSTISTLNDSFTKNLHGTWNGKPKDLVTNWSIHGRPSSNFPHTCKEIWGPARNFRSLAKAWVATYFSPFTPIKTSLGCAKGAKMSLHCVVTCNDFTLLYFLLGTKLDTSTCTCSFERKKNLFNHPIP